MSTNSLRRSCLVAAAALFAIPLSSLLHAQDADMPPPPPAGEMPPGESAGAPTQANSSGTASNAEGNRRQRDGQQGNRFNQEEMRNRLMKMLREQMGNPADAEWSIIAERLQKVSDIRMANMQSGMGMGMMRGMGGPGGMGRNRQQSAEVESLSSAIKDNAPAAEIKARLTRLRDVRKEQEDKLTKAQEDLRAVLDVKQEAVAVLFGLLP